MIMRWLKGLLLLGLVGYALTGVVQVRPGERAVVRRFGRVLEHKPEPGLWVGLPWGMDRVDRVAVDKVQSVVVGYQEETDDGLTVPAGQLLTGDHNLVDVQVVITYKVRPEAVEDYVTQQDRVDGLIARAAEAVMAEWVAGRVVDGQDGVLITGKNAMRPRLVQGTQDRVEDYHLGVQILDARVTLIAPPAEVKNAFDNVVRAETAMATQRNNAEQDADRKLRSALADKFKLERQTAAYAESRKLLAQREADSFTERLKQYRLGRQQNPLYLRQIWEEERGKLFARLKQNGQLGLLDHHLGPDGLDMTIAPLPKKP
jgi:membrane protease subunit HflK